MIKKNARLVLLSMMFFLIGCTNLPPWKTIIRDSGFLRLTLNPKNNALMLLDNRYSNKFYYFSDSSNIEQKPSAEIAKIDIDNSCLTEKIWFVTLDKHLVQYLPDTQATISYPEIDKLGDVNFCAVTNNGTLIIWGEHFLATFDNAWHYQFFFDQKIRWAVEDDDNSFWILSTQGIIYRNLNGVWQVFGELPAEEVVRTLWIVEKTLWIGTYNGVYEWSLSYKLPKMLIKFKFDEENRGIVPVIVDVKKSRNGETWILGLTGIWRIKNDSVSQVSLPNQESSISDAALDTVNDKIYAISRTGLYILDLKP